MQGRSITFALGLLALGCHSTSSKGTSGTGGGSTCDGGAAACDGGPARTLVYMDFQGTEGFYASPFPNDSRTLAGFPNPNANLLANRVIAMLADPGGFGLTSGVFFETSAALDATDLPSLAGSVAPTSPVTLLGIDPSSPDYLVRYPIQVGFLADAGPYGGENLLALLPLQGVPLLPKTRYAAVVSTSLHDTTGATLAPMTAFASGARPPGITDAGFATYQAALTALGAAKIDEAQVAGLAAFTTGSPTDALGKVVAAMKVSPPAPSAAWTPNEVFPTFCVYSTTISMPEYQEGVPPYTDSGGDWVFDASGNPVLQRMEPANFVVTIPRQAMPAAGYPIVVLSRTGAGGNRPLVDRGPQGVTNGPPLMPGTGPALLYASVGYAGSEIDGPLGGLRNPNPADNEDFTIFNVGNPPALRDNVRQSAAELALQAHILEKVSVDVSACAGATAPGNMATFDVTHMALQGHSMGATIAPLALAFEPRFTGGLLDGAGGSIIENVMYKLDPVPVLGLAQVLIGVNPSQGYALSPLDPMLSLFQWATESSDPPVYGKLITSDPVGGPRNVLMMQGIVDHYIMPPIANATSLSLGLDLAGPELDATAANAPNYVLVECGCNTSSPCYAQCTTECMNTAQVTPLPMDACFTCLTAQIADKTSACVAGSALTPVGPLLPLVGRGVVSLPATGNRTLASGAKVTAIFTQNQGDGIEDGHEVAFQTDGPKHQYTCFLKGLLTGTPSVPTAGVPGDPCQ
jgi:hypothetical protein